ncbi:isochorismatase family protein [Streptomyces parvulus]|uniref:isochorismatase family protein n=1 Tax=Streptomyces parvulus TaxID=146923 RepID=UPI003D75797E
MPPRSALLVIDMQNATVALAYRAAETVAAIAGLSARARAAGVPVVVVRQRDESMVPGTEGWQVVPELAPREGDSVNALYRSIGWPGRRVRLRAAADVELSPA